LGKTQNNYPLTNTDRNLDKYDRFHLSHGRVACP
jgi:hypothetical protein